MRSPWVHRLSQVNLERMTAECANCGYVRVKAIHKGKVRCNEAIKNDKRNRHARLSGLPISVQGDNGTTSLQHRPNNCQICFGEGIICYDHNHATGEFRGWLCRSCNVGLGYFRDNAEYLASAIKYLS